MLNYLREPVPGEKVSVYFNLRKKVWSVRGKDKRVIAHLKTLSLQDVTWKVSEAGRQRVLREKQKNVHAYAEGTFISAEAFCFEDPSPQAISYNPYKGSSFMAQGGGPISSSKRVHFYGDRTVYGWGNS